MEMPITAVVSEVSIRFLDFIFFIVVSILCFPLYQRVAKRIPIVIPAIVIVVKVKNNRSDSVSIVSSVVKKEIEVEIKNIEKFKKIEFGEPCSSSSNS